MSAPVTSPQAASARPGLDVERLRREFPILATSVRGKPLAYLDNAASAQKPEAVIDAVSRVYRESYANVHRGVHYLAERATAAYEGARVRVARHVGAASPSEIVFVRGTTEAINLVAASFARPRLRPGDEVLITWLEHHSNIVPWQLACEATGAHLRVAPIDDRGEVDLEAFRRLLGERTRIAAFAHISNSLGTVNPVREMAAMAREAGAAVLLDGAQAVPHQRVDVQALGCDFYAFSGHKAYGPSGIGALWGRRELLESMPPWQGGGEMIRQVTFEGSEYRETPARFEAGTPNISGAVGMAAALEYLEQAGLEAVAAHEADLLAYATEAVGSLPGVRLVGTARRKAAVLSFLVDGVHAHDVGTVLDSEGVAIRAGHHCAQPVMERFGVAATARASFGLYNTRGEVERLVAGIEQAQRLFSR